MAVDRRQRIVIATPLNALWSDDGDVEAERVRNLDVDSITLMLRAGAVQFVVADIGLPLRWTPADETSEFWKTTVSNRLVDRRAGRFSPDDFPDGYCYTATLWRVEDSHEIVVLETHHRVGEHGTRT